MLALSVRQPWAWAIIHAGKDVENRSWSPAGGNARQARQLAVQGERIAIHAAAGMTQLEYHEFADFWFGDLGRHEPMPGLKFIDRGGIIGTVRLVDVITASPSRWFFGPLGLVLAEPEPRPFQPCKGTIAPMFWLVPEAV
jgi:hypothetical protein